MELRKKEVKHQRLRGLFPDTWFLPHSLYPPRQRSLPRTASLPTLATIFLPTRERAGERRSAAIIYPARVATVHATCITRVHDARTRSRVRSGPPTHARSSSMSLSFLLSLSRERERENFSQKRTNDTAYRITNLDSWKNHAKNSVSFKLLRSRTSENNAKQSHAVTIAGDRILESPMMNN